ncbi:MAG: hypothetical protein LBJ93_03390 [Clostridiales bacterium]|jgi:hypothetical protein|nr:hypothetical protein [Clostridiales bacterium]
MDFNKKIEKHYKFKALLPETLSMFVETSKNILKVGNYTSLLHKEMQSVYTSLGEGDFFYFCLFIAASASDDRDNM